MSTWVMELSTNEAQGNSTVIISSSLETSTISINTYLTPFDSTISITLPQSTNYPTFDNTLNQQITSLFSLQSTEGHKSIPEDDTTEDGEFMGSFVEIQFDLEEKNIPEHILMFGKQFKTLKRKLNSLLQLQADEGGSKLCVWN